MGALQEVVSFDLEDAWAFRLRHRALRHHCVQRHGVGLDYALYRRALQLRPGMAMSQRLPRRRLAAISFGTWLALQDLKRALLPYPQAFALAWSLARGIVRCWWRGTCDGRMEYDGACLFAMQCRSCRRLWVISEHD